MEQRDDGWHEARRTRLNASEAGGLLDLSPYVSARAARKQWVAKYHGERRDFSNADMQRGVDLEAGILDKLEQVLGEVIQQDAGREFEDWLRASADGYSGEFHGTVYEVKAPRKFFDLMERPDYLLQLYLQMVCYGAARGVFAQGVMDPDGVLVTTHLVFDIDKLAEAINSHTLLTGLDFIGCPPLLTLKTLWLEMVAEPAPTEAELFSTEAWELAQQLYVEAKKADAEAKEQLESARAALLAACDNQQVRGSRYQVIEATRTGSLNARKLQAEHPDIDLDQYRGKTSTYMTIRETK